MSVRNTVQLAQRLNCGSVRDGRHDRGTDRRESTLRRKLRPKEAMVSTQPYADAGQPRFPRRPMTACCFVRLGKQGAFVQDAVERGYVGVDYSMVSSDGEYEYWITVEAARIPLLLARLGAPERSDILEVLDLAWTGERSYELERIIRDDDVPHRLSSYS